VAPPDRACEAGDNTRLLDATWGGRHLESSHLRWFSRVTSAIVLPVSLARGCHFLGDGASVGFSSDTSIRIWRHVPRGNIHRWARTTASRKKRAPQTASCEDCAALWLSWLGSFHLGHSQEYSTAPWRFRPFATSSLRRMFEMIGKNPLPFGSCCSRIDAI